MIYIVPIVMAVLAAIWVSRDAKKRGLSTDIWTILAFLAAPIVLPLYLVVRETKIINNDNLLAKASFITTQKLLTKYNSNMKTLSIIGIIWYLFIFGAFVSVLDDPYPDYDNAIFYVFLGFLYAILFAIIMLVISFKKAKLSNKRLTLALKNLGELKENGILTDEEFSQQKSFILQGKY